MEDLTRDLIRISAQFQGTVDVRDSEAATEVAPVPVQQRRRRGLHLRGNGGKNQQGNINCGGSEAAVATVGR